jgi:glycerophosphoryl diester phosphodiesterase
VSLLDDVLQEFANTDLAQQIQIKGEHPDTVKSVLEKTKQSKNYIITAFDLDVIKEIKEIDKSVPVGWLVKPAQEKGSEGTTDLTAAVTINPDALPEYSEEELQTILQKAKINFVEVILLCGPRIKNQLVIDKIHVENMEVGAWGVGTNLDLAKKLINFQIDRFTLDNPEQL